MPSLIESLKKSTPGEWLFALVWGGSIFAVPWLYHLHTGLILRF